MEIIPLEKEYLPMAIKLVDSIFDESDMIDNPASALKASLSEKEYLNYSRHKDSEVKNLEYYLALDKAKVIGIIGLYTLKRDTIFFNKTKNVIWIDWFGVAEDYRGKNVGSRLLDYITKVAVARGYDYLFLFTSTDDSEVAAQYVYEKQGFKILDIKKNKEYDLLLRGKRIKNNG